MRYARCQYQGATFEVGDLRDFSLRENVDAVICLDSSLLYCHTDRRLESCLSSCRRHLRDGGLLVAEMRNGAFFLGNTELLDGPTHSSFSWQGVTWHAGDRTVDRPRPPVVASSQTLECFRPIGRPRPDLRLAAAVPRRAHRPPAPRRLSRSERSFDTPGPRAEGGWQTPPEPRRLPRLLTATPLSGDRLHVVAEAI